MRITKVRYMLVIEIHSESLSVCGYDRLQRSEHAIKLSGLCGFLL